MAQRPITERMASLSAPDGTRLKSQNGGSGTAPALQRDAGDSRSGRARVCVAADDDRPRPAEPAARLPYLDRVGDVAADGVPARLGGGDAGARKAGRPVRQGAVPAPQPARVLRRLRCGHLCLEHLVADRLPGDSGLRRGRFPAVVRDRLRRVPAEQGGLRRGDGLGDPRGRRRARPRLVGRPRRLCLLAVDLHRRCGLRRRFGNRCVALRAGVAGQDAVEAGSGRRGPALGGARDALARPDRRPGMGLGIDPGRRPPRRERGARRCCGCASSCVLPSRWSTSG